MKKYLIFLLISICFIPCFSACKKQNNLLSSVSELRCETYQGQSDNFTVKAGYGFKEQPFVNDGKVGKTVNLLSFRLLDKEADETSYSITFNFNQTEYKGTFKLNPVTNAVTCSIEIDEFDLKEFTVNISSGTESESVLLKSIIPNTAITYSSALDYLVKNQQSLISHYTNQDGIFNAEIHLRILVKDGAPYWYVGIASGGDKLKALLIDGISGETLAIREIF